jgi:hypothetical protein
VHYNNNIQKLSREHIKYVLGINIPLNESIQIDLNTSKLILESQLLYETFLDTVTNYAKEKYDKTITKIQDFAKEKYDKVVTNIKTWAEAAVMFGRVLSNSTTLQNFSDNFWKTFKNNSLKIFNGILDKLGLSSFKEKITSLVDKITSLEGWQKFLAATAIASIVKYVVDSVKKLPKDEIEKYITNYISDKGLKDILGKLTDIKSYFGWLQPIIKSVEVFYNTIKPTLDKFNLKVKANTEEPAITENIDIKDELSEGEYCKECLAEYITECWGKPVEELEEAEYRGRKVTLGKPFLTPDGPKKRSVYVKNAKGNVVKVNFGQKGVAIKKRFPNHRKSYRARHHCDTNPGPKDRANYWSCRFW